MKKTNLKQIPLLLVATLMVVNGFVNIIFAFIPSTFYKTYDIPKASQIFSYGIYQQANLMLTIIFGFILILLGIGLYKRRRSAWTWSVIMLTLLIIDNAYPTITPLPLTLGIISLVVLIAFHHQFHNRRRATQTHVVIAWISVIFAMGYGAIGCYLMRGQFKGIHNFTDAIYYTLVTYSTVGYGDITPITTNAKVFVITMIAVGLGSFATVITVLLGPLLERRLKRIFTMVEHLSHMKNHAILCGVTNITQQIANDLKKAGINVLFVEQDQDQLSEMELHDFDTFRGNPSDSIALKKAGLLDAKYIVCNGQDDANSILLTMIAKNCLASSKKPAKIITILDNPSNKDNALNSGADELIIPAILSSSELLGYINRSKAT